MKLYYSLALIIYSGLFRIGGSMLLYVVCDGAIPLVLNRLSHLTLLQRKGGQCLVGSLTGEVAC